MLSVLVPDWIQYVFARARRMFWMVKLNQNNRPKSIFRHLKYPCVQDSLMYCNAHWQISKLNKIFPNWWASAGTLPKTCAKVHVPLKLRKKQLHYEAYGSTATSSFRVLLQTTGTVGLISPWEKKGNWAMRWVMSPSCPSLYSMILRNCLMLRIVLRIVSLLCTASCLRQVPTWKSVVL